MRAGILDTVRRLLAFAGYCVSCETEVRPIAFDVVARRDNDLLILKVLTNVDSLNVEAASEIKTLAQMLGAKPLLVGERSSSRDLEDGAVYVRHGVPILNVRTLEEYLLEGVQPLVYAAPGGFYVHLDGEKLRALRAAHGVSLGELAQAVGVSRRAIAMYEEGMGAMVDVAARIEEFFGTDIARPVDPFNLGSQEHVIEVNEDALKTPLEREISVRMRTIGFEYVPIGRSPFNAISRDSRVTILTGISLEVRDVRRKAAAISNLCEVTERVGAFFVERLSSSRVELEGTPLISRGELDRCEGAEDVMDLITERRPRRAPPL